MSDPSLRILDNPAVSGRVSAATRAVLEERANPPAYTQFLHASDFAVLQALVETVLPQDGFGTQVDLAQTIDRRLAEGSTAGWRYAELPADGEAYRRGLGILREASFLTMSREEREAFLRSVAQGEMDEEFALSRFLQLLRRDAARFWMAHPETMEALELYSFADGDTGRTNGPTETEGWVKIASVGEVQSA